MTKVILDLTYVEARYITISLQNHAAHLRGGWNESVVKDSMSKEMVDLANKIELKKEKCHEQEYHSVWCEQINKQLAKDYK